MRSLQNSGWELLPGFETMPKTGSKWRKTDSDDGAVFVPSTQGSSQPRSGSITWPTAALERVPAPAGLAPAERRIDHYGRSVSDVNLAFSAVAARPSGPGGDCGKCEGAARRRFSYQSFAPLGQAQRGRRALQVRLHLHQGFAQRRAKPWYSSPTKILFVPGQRAEVPPGPANRRTLARWADVPLLPSAERKATLVSSSILTQNITRGATDIPGLRPFAASGVSRAKRDRLGNTEYRNPKQIQNTKPKCLKRLGLSRFGFASLFWIFVLWICFGFRYFDFGFLHRAGPSARITSQTSPRNDSPAIGSCFLPGFCSALAPGLWN